MQSKLYICFLALVSFLASCSSTEVIDLRIIHTTDVHGNLFPYDDINERAGTGSMARLSSLMQVVRKESPNTLLLDGGDMLQGEPITYYSNYIDTTQSNAVTVAMNYLQYDAACIGNHDLEPGHTVYDRFVREAKFPVLGANAIDTKTDKPYFTPYKVFDRGGAKVLVLGLTTPAVPQWLPEHLWSGIRFEDIVESAKVWVPKLLKEEEPDLFIALIHSGLENNNEDYIENAGEALAQTVPGIDLILMGHDHKQNNKWIKRAEGDSVLVINPANHLDKVSDIRVQIRKKGTKVEKEIKADFLDVNAYDADPEYNRALLTYAEGVKTFLAQRVGILHSPVRASDALLSANPYLSVLHDMQRTAVAADVSFAAPLNIFAELSGGDIFVRDLFKWCPFSNHLYAMELSGAEIKGYLEHSYAGWVTHMTSPEDYLIKMKEGVKAEDKYKTAVPTYNYSSAYGIDYTVDVSKAPGERVLITQMSNGQPFDLNKKYRVAINSYRAGGAGGMLTIGAGIDKSQLKSRIVQSSSDDQFMLLMKYFQTKGVVTPNEVVNWSFAPKAWTEPAGKRDVAFILAR